jgi:hypothetical protein
MNGSLFIQLLKLVCRKCPVLKTFTVHFRIVNDAVLIDLGRILSSSESEHMRLLLRFVARRTN